MASLALSSFYQHQNTSFIANVAIIFFARVFLGNFHADHLVLTSECLAISKFFKGNLRKEGAGLQVNSRKTKFLVLKI